MLQSNHHFDIQHQYKFGHFDIWAWLDEPSEYIKNMFN